jgi:hypothetical protein
MSFIDYAMYDADDTLVRYDCQMVCYSHRVVLLDLECGDLAHGIRRCMWGGDMRKGLARIDLPGLDRAVSGS